MQTTDCILRSMLNQSEMPRPQSSFCMRHLLWILLAWCLCTHTAWAQNLLTQTTVRSEQVTAELLIHAPQGVAPGQPMWAGLQLTHAPDWHTYWKNPGDSGLPTQLEWTLPPGVVAGDILWPTPKKFPLEALANHGYDGTVLLAVPLTITPDFTAHSLSIGLQASWLVCRKECIPEEGRFSLTVRSGQSLTLNGLAFEAAQSRLPIHIAESGLTTRVEGQFLSLTWPQPPAEWRDQVLEFFPETPGLTEPGAAWQQTWAGDSWSARIPLSPLRTESPSTLAAVLAPGQLPHGQAAPAGRAWQGPVSGIWPAAQTPANAGVSDALQAALDDNARRAATGVPPTTATTTNTGSSLGLVGALLGALIGGLILNLMPCVFPVLAIKVLAFAQHADNPRAHRLAGLAYTVGVVVSFLALGGLLLALRSAGEQLGWGFQLQNPAVVAALATLFTLIALNLAGMFEFGHVLPSAVATLQARHPVADALLTGVLATAIASPCTAPFMGASLGLAIGLPTVQAMAVFATLGLGMALPYLLASWVPAVARALPRPGAWMQTLRQLLAFPMWATVVWLLWVLGQQSGVDGAASLLTLLVALAWLVWALGLQGRSRRVLAGLALATLVWLLWTVGPNVTRMLPPPTETSAANTSATHTDQATWQAWSPERQADLQAQGRPVFIDFTAAWCVTCQYNKRTTLAHPDVLSDMAQRNVALLRADWTRRDPAVTQALQALGRNGVPVYVLIAPGQSPVVLTEVLTVNEVRTALAGL